MAHVAFIGLGRMGHGMAGRYLDAGFSLAVWNRSKAKAEDLIARGARWATSPADAADGADAIVTMVADDAASRAVWLGKDGAARSAKAGTLAIECSTVSYGHALDLARELRGRGLIYIDSPVTGLPDAAAAGKLTLLVGAEPADLESARPYLAPLSTTIRHFGAVGSGTVYKLINKLAVLWREVRNSSHYTKFSKHLKRCWDGSPSTLSSYVRGVSADRGRGVEPAPRP